MSIDLSEFWGDEVTNGDRLVNVGLSTQLNFSLSSFSN